MKIELLYFEGCPSYEAFLPELRGFLDQLGVSEEIELRRVESPEAAARERFLGSPTVRVEGADVEPGAERRADFGLQCRLYKIDRGQAPTPQLEWAKAALEDALR